MKKLAQLKIDKLPVIVTKEPNGLFVVESPVLDLATQGKDLEEAKSRFSELVVIFFEEITEMDTVEEVLTSLGWSKVKKQWQPPVVVESSMQEVNVTAGTQYVQA
jgi:predicted RNase H-like HicB family nuclease